MNVAALQLPNIGMSTTKLYHYVRIAHKRGVKVLLLGEYLLNAFFKELLDTPLPMLKELSDHQLKVLKELASNHDMIIVAPMVIVQSNRPYKVVAKISPRSISYYHQQILINYPHWDESSFFNNDVAPIVSPMVFKVGDVRFGIIGGYELHFDAFWHFVFTRHIDCMLLPTASTFESDQRWRDLVCMRAFTHNCYVMRANRIGEHADGEHRWRFYGDSLLANPYGEIESHLGDSEELMVASVDRRVVVEARQSWHFKEALEQRDA